MNGASWVCLHSYMRYEHFSTESSKTINFIPRELRMVYALFSGFTPNSASDFFPFLGSFSVWARDIHIFFSYRCSINGSYNATRLAHIIRMFAQFHEIFCSQFLQPKNQYRLIFNIPILHTKQRLHASHIPSMIHLWWSNIENGLIDSNQNMEIVLWSQMLHA